MTEATVDGVRAALAALEDDKTRAVNERHGDDHGVKLSALRQVAKDAGKDQDLARALWATGETAPRLVALLVCRVREFDAAELDEMMREARAPKVLDWLTNYVVKKSRHAEELRLAWHGDPDPNVAAAAWALTAERVAKQPDGLDLDALLEEIEAGMREAPGREQWEMNTTLAQIGIEHPDKRDRALDIGERLEVLKDYRTPPNCTSPFAPIWIREIVARRGG
ncbi:DNA alkylation repair protein [Microbacterium excoecariae]|uniref:DNA alkylation repair protein n=1 Tax=Microbacterium excoecariae TaxID=2715210 RepID=UPI00140A75D0|nr:DNA alkylation repair protein [Microbacterium excoecariae]NHI16700.1 DNA alkylation repair protein [Microbacterium excoecariae]